MAIKGNLSSGLVAATLADFTILENTSNGRFAIQSISLAEAAGTGDTIELFKSPDNTSAAGTRIDEIVLAADETKKAIFTPFNLAKDEFLVGKALVGALANVEAIYIAYTGSS